MKNRFALFILIAVLIGSCAPTPSNTATASQPSSTVIADSPTATIAPSATPTPVPITLPVDRFNPIPELNPITTENIDALEEVAFFDNSPISTHITEDKSRLTVWFESGLQTFDMPTLTPHPFIRMNMSIFSSNDAISEDGRLFARAYPGVKAEFWTPTIFIWDTETGEEVCKIKLSEHRGNFFYTNFHLEQNTFSIHGDLGPNGKHKVIIYGLNTCQRIFDRDSDSAMSAISPDGKYAAVTQKGQVVIYDTSTKSHNAIGETRGAQGVAFLPDSGEVAISYSGQTFLYDMASGEVNGFFDAGISNFYSTISVLDHGEWVVISASEKNYFWNSSEKQVYSVQEFIGRDFKFSNGILTTYKTVFNLRTKAKISIENYGPQASTALSSDQSYLAVSSNIPPFVTDIYETATGKQINSIKGVYGPIAVGSDSFIASSHEVGKVFNFITGESDQDLDHSYLSGFLLDEKEIVTWDALGKISLLDIKTGKAVTEANLPVFPSSFLNYTRYKNATPLWDELSQSDFASLPPSNIMVSNDRTIGIQENNGQLQIFALSDGNFIPATDDPIAAYNLTNLGFQFKFSPDDTIIAGANYNSLTLWDGQTGDQLERIGLPNGAVTDIRFSADGTKIVISKNDGPPQINAFGNLSLIIFDVLEKKIVQDYKLNQQLNKTGCNTTLPFALTSDGGRVVTLTQDCKIGVYDSLTFEELSSFGSPYSDSNPAFSISPDNNLLVVVDRKNIEIWDIKTEKRIRKMDIPELAGTFDFYAHKAAFTSDGKMVIVNSTFWSQSSVTTFWAVPSIQ